MKKIFILLSFVCVFQSNTFAQYASPEEEILDIVKLQEPLPRGIFLDSVSLPGMKVYVGNTRQGWVSEKPDTQKISQLYDIRLKFVNHDSALSFHRRFEGINSEFGKEITNHRLNTTGADDFKAFGGSEESVKLLTGQGLQMFCFTMVVDRYFAKLFLLCNIHDDVRKYQPLITDLITRIKNQR